jgi:hypothetical protein
MIMMLEKEVRLGETNNGITSLICRFSVFRKKNNMEIEGRRTTTWEEEGDQWEGEVGQERDIIHMYENDIIKSITLLIYAKT